MGLHSCRIAPDLLRMCRYRFLGGVATIRLSGEVNHWSGTTCERGNCGKLGLPPGQIHLKPLQFFQFPVPCRFFSHRGGHATP